MKVTQKVQLEPEDLDFIDRVCASSHYGSKSQYMRALRKCADAAIKKDPSAAGVYRLEFELHPNGSVTD